MQVPVLQVGLIGSAMISKKLRARSRVVDAISDIWDQACEDNSKDTNAKSPKFIRLEAKTDL